MQFLSNNLTILSDLISAPPVRQAAYLDPGSGSFILQVLLASLVGIGFTVRAYWDKIKTYFRKDSEDQTQDDLE